MLLSCSRGWYAEGEPRTLGHIPPSGDWYCNPAWNHGMILGIASDLDAVPPDHPTYNTRQRNNDHADDLWPKLGPNE